MHKQKLGKETQLRFLKLIKEGSYVNKITQ